MQNANFEDIMGRFRDWGDSSLGRAFMAAEQDAQEALAAEMFGYHFLQLGQLGNQPELEGGQFRYRILDSAVSFSSRQRDTSCGRIMGDPASLPVGSETMAAVSLGHVLEFHPNPHQVLREVDRVLIPEGYLLLTGFNPLSSWRVWQALRAGSGEMPWSAHFISPRRLRDWLGLLNLEALDYQGFFYRPPLTSRAMLNRLDVLERWGNQGRWGLRESLAAGYVLLARKRTLPLTPIRPRWRPKRRLLGAGAVGPSSRDIHQNRNRD